MKPHILILFGALLALEWVPDSAFSIDQKRMDDARQYFDEGLLSHDEGNLDDALPFYRAAVRLYPQSVEYLLRLGNTEYQLGFLEQASRRFKAALNLDPKSTSAKYFIKMIDSKLQKQRFIICVGDDCVDEVKGIRNTQPLQELPINVLERDMDGHSFLFPSFVERARRPFAVRGALQHIGCNMSVFSPISLNMTYSTHIVDFYPQNMLTKPTKVYTVPFGKALDFLAYPEGAYFSVDTSESGTYIQWNMNETTWDGLLDQAGLLNTLPDVLTHSMDSLLGTQSHSISTTSSVGVDVDARGSSDVTAGVGISTGGTAKLSAQDIARVKHSFGLKTHWYMLLIGEEGAGMFGHHDTLPVGSWQAQAVGSKRWVLCAPAGDSTTEKSSDCYETTLYAGDLIYYPPYYWHETMNLETPTVSLSGTVVLDTPAVVRDQEHSGENRANFMISTYRDELLVMLRAECRKNSKGFSFELMFCDLIS